MLNHYSADHVTVCKKCRIEPIKFDPNQRSKNGKLIPIEVETNKPHYCDISSPFACMYCGLTIYLDKKVLSPNGKRIPLDFNTEEYHACKNKQRPQSELRYFKKRGVFTN